MTTRAPDPLPTAPVEESILGPVLLGCLLRIRQAAFAPEIGVRYTEAIRAEIEQECRRLEDFVRAQITARAKPHPPRTARQDLTPEPATPPGEKAET
jgi:hypothetical protein